MLFVSQRHICCYLKKILLKVFDVFFATVTIMLCLFVQMCMRLNKALGLLVSDYDAQEAMFVDFMQSAAEQYQMSEEEKKAHESSRKKSKRKRYLAIGLAAVGGGALIGLTGGLAAPLVAGQLSVIELSRKHHENN